MPASEAQIRANRQNAQRSTGPRTDEGKAASRSNATTHGLTASTVLPEREATEVARRFGVFCRELNPSGEVALTLILRMATLSARMERCVTFEKALLTDRVRRAKAEFVPPEGADEAEGAKLRNLAGELALFDPSREAVLARKYEAEAHRGFLRCLKELHQHERTMQAAKGEAEAEAEAELLASFSGDEMTDEEFDSLERGAAVTGPKTSAKPADRVDLAGLRGRVDVPIAVGRRR